MILENTVSFFFGAILTFAIQRLFGVNKEFFKIIDDFKRKLPPNSKKAESKINENAIHQHINLNTLKTNIEARDIDYFLKQLEDFNYRSFFFKKHAIKCYSDNIRRLINTTESELVLIGFLQEFLENKEREGDKPYILGSKIAEYLKF